MLVTVAEAREGCPKAPDGPNGDALLTSLITRWGATAARRCGFPPASAGASPTMESTSYTLNHDGRGGRDLQLRVYPATAIASVYDDPTLDFTDSTYLVASSDYALVENGRILRLKSTATHGAWGRGPSRIRVAMTAGHATTPDELKQLCILGVRNWFDLRDQQGKTGAAQGGNSASFDQAAFLPEWIEAPLVGAFGLLGCMV